MDLFFIITTLMSIFMGEQSSQQSMEQFNAEQLEQQQSNLSNQLSQNQANITGYEQELYDEDSPLNFIGGLYNKLTGKIKQLKNEDKQLKQQQENSSSGTQTVTPQQAQVLYNMTHQNQCFALRLHHRRLLGSKNEPKHYSEAETKQ